jgi:hypothetical protein
MSDGNERQATKKEARIGAGPAKPKRERLMTPNQYAARHKLDPQSVRKWLRARFDSKHQYGGNDQHKHGARWMLTPAMIAALNGALPRLRQANIISYYAVLFSSPKRRAALWPLTLSSPRDRDSGQ